MSISRRITDNPLGFLKDDLLLALRRIQMDLDACADGAADAAALETMVDAIDQIRNPLAALDHRDAAALLDAMRATVQGGLHAAPLKITLLKQAAQQLTAYLETYLYPGNRQANPSALVETTAALRQADQDNASSPDPLESSMGLRGLREVLDRLQRTLVETVEKAADEAMAWQALQNDLALLRQLMAERDGEERPLRILERLRRIVDTLAGGGAEHYGVLVSGVCAEILASLRYTLEWRGEGVPALATVLSHAETHLAQLDTLLGLPANLQALPDPPRRAQPTVASSPDQARSTTADAPGRLDFDSLDLTLPVLEPAQPAAPGWLDFDSLDLTLPALEPAQPAAPGRLDFDSLDLTLPALEPAQPAAPTASISEAPIMILNQTPELLEGAENPPNPAEDAVEDAEDLLRLIGLDNTDPEFAEVFIEEARGELEAMREQLAHWREDLTDRPALTAIRRAFHTLKGSGRMVNALVIGDFAWELESLLNQVLEGSLPVRHEVLELVAAAVTALEPLVGAAPRRPGELEALAALTAQARSLPGCLRTAPEPSPQPLETTPGASPSIFAPDADAEFVEVFLEEAHGELATIRKHLPIWRAHFEDRQALTTLRRAFHTLKGSGRVVGALMIGDFAWCFENLLNQMLNGALAATPAIAELLDEATVVLEGLLSQGAQAERALQQLPIVTARVEALSQTTPVEAPPVVAKAPAPVELPAPVEAPAPIELPAPVVAEAPAPVALPAPVVAEAPAPIGLPAPVEAKAPEPAKTPAIDLELAQVFQYEAAEILDASDLILQGLAAEPDNTALLNDLRRGMHTLKGSSRMAGIMTVGDLAHAAESVLDALGKGLGQATPAILDTLQHALDRLNQMLAEAASGVSPAAAVELIDDLHQLADGVTGGTPPQAQPAGVVQPALVAETGSFRAMTELDQELVQVFQAEAGEILDSSDTLLLRLRDELDNVELLNDLRREMHTLKGSSRMAGFMTVGDVAHAAESVLDALGKGALKMSAPVLEQVQGALDQLHQMLAGVVSGQQPGPRPELIERLHGVLGGQPAEPPPRLAAAPAAVALAARPVEKPAPAAAPADAIRVSAALLNNLVNQMGESSIFRARVDQGVGAMSNNLNDLEQTITRLRRQVTHLATQAEARIQSRQDQGPKAHQEEFDPLELDRFTELQQVSRSLMEIADDLGNIGNTLGEHAREITTLLDQQGKVNKEIQQGLMRTGMVRFGSVIPRLRRVVRQAAQDLGKRAELLVGGEEAEVDRTVLENMLAPLEHMLRNSLAHGIETPERRRSAGKSEIGTITLSLRREGAELVLELSDDGAGLNFAAIRAKGEEKGLLLPGQPATSEELIALLLRPGFSTATAVTQVSGRGVGMDVVNEAIRAMRGALLIQTESGQGSRFIIRLPFSLAVTQALLVRAGDGLFAIPLLSIEVVTRLKESEFQAYLTGELVQHQYSDRHYPVHNLGILVGSEHLLPFEEAQDRRPPTLLFRSAEASAALQVEAVLGNQEIIVKPISPQFNGVPGISGATVLGDGRVVVVLELAALVRNIGSQRQKQLESRALRAARQETRQEKLTIMVIDDSITMRKVTARILERHNITAVTAKDGLDAVAMLQTQVPDLAILDIEMPRMDGFEVVAHVRNQTALRHLPIIMVTSRGGEKHRERAMSLGVNDYLTKPYQEDQLMDSIRNILGERALDLIA